MKTENITKRQIDGVRCNCGQSATVYERSDTSSGPYARLHCPCGYVTHWWAVGWQSGELAREWVAMQRRARMQAITANWPRDARDRRIRELEAKCRELEWAREEAEVMEWGRLQLGEMAEKIEELQTTNEDYIERLRACGVAARSAERNMAVVRRGIGRLCLALRGALAALEDRYGRPEEWADVQETVRVAEARSAIVLARAVLVESGDGAKVDAE